MQSGFRSDRQKKRLMAEINVVPYIDVTLVLLIIFMVTAPIVQQSVTVSLPQTPEVISKTNEVTEENKPFVITVTNQGLYKTSEQPDTTLSSRDLESLVAEVMARSQLNQEQPIYIQGDRTAPYGKVVHIFVLLKANGVENVSLMTEPELVKP
ncbi:ExbD/TolR family protein [Thiomicrorhabdus lithotrophica]|uniref:Tol-Pal system protein TolR n=1 Tax=Thiomicrorhabdus lithotrophica TaxID=2949997 RepID=A0ABY8C864_9GAMM|nr:ExbD/TolR family protein [Thiomicrorhabdus lithotrophica]WEJ61737.1 ExbD/TolR family protein [Thiomicrorhabdus lithotrophica]